MKLPNIIFAENENENSYECIPSTVHSEIAAYYVYSQWHSKKTHHMLTLILTKKQRIGKHINKRNQKN